MRIKTRLCSICDHWHSKAICPSCGAILITIGSKHSHVNRMGISMVRGIPRPIHRLIRMNDSERDS